MIQMNRKTHRHKNKLMVTKGQTGWEEELFGISRYTLLNMKQINKKIPLYRELYSISFNKP